MPLPPPTVARTLVHTRRVRFEGYKRADGLWDIEAHLTDIKPTDYRLASGVRPAGLPVHDMWIRLTVDRDLRVVDAFAITDAMPYPPYCSAVNPDYRQLIGLQLARGFRKAVHDRFHDVAGCTHINELLAQFPSAAVQIMAGDKVDNADEGGRKPFQLDRCMALDTAGEGVRQFYPRWYRSTEEEVG
jgi:hypothetical protein